MAKSDEYEYTGPEPLNREPDVGKLVSSFLTDDGFDRNHGDIPILSADTHVVRIDGAIRSPLTLSISQLQHDYPQHDVICALQCAGNRRHTMRTLLKEVQGIDWGDSAVMNCAWRGPKLADVLRKAGLKLDGSAEDAAYEGWHVAFACNSTQCQEDSWYGGSIPLERAMRDDGDVILALERNHAPLSPKHGFPVRAVAPGIIGARSVKWLDRITVQREESQNHYERHDYKLLPPEAVDAESAEKFWDQVPPLLDNDINSVIAVPASGSTVQRDGKGMINIKGYALPAGMEGPIVRVELSIDEGSTWTEATLIDPGENIGDASLKFAWRLWEAKLPIEKGEGRMIVSRAIDRGGNMQSAKTSWNLRGVSYNAYGRVDNLKVV